METSTNSFDRFAFFPARSKQKNRRIDLLDHEQPKTVVIFGVPRGGTTMVARVVSALGVYLGNDIGINYEDNSFNLDILNLSPTKDFAELERVLNHEILLRNRTHQTWGWKYPRAGIYLPLILQTLRNPYLICVFRDCVATSSRSLGKSQRQGLDPMAVLERNINIQMKNIDLIAKAGVPSLLCSYEKAIASPEDFVKEIRRFLGIPPNKKLVRSAINQIAPGQYLKEPHD